MSIICNPHLHKDYPMISSHHKTEISIAFRFVSHFLNVTGERYRFYSSIQPQLSANDSFLVFLDSFPLYVR